MIDSHFSQIQTYEISYKKKKESKRLKLYVK